MRIDILGCQVDNLTMEETLEAVASFVTSGKPHQHVVVNVDKLVKAHRDPQLRRIINNCDLVNADGMPVVWASRLLGRPLKERVAGVDLFEALMRRAATTGWRVFLLGAREDVVTQVRATYGAKYPGLIIAGHRNGYWRPGEEAAVVEQITQACADLLFVAISSPQKEQFLGRYQSQMRVPFAMGVGGTFDAPRGASRVHRCGCSGPGWSGFFASCKSLGACSGATSSKTWPFLVCWGASGGRAGPAGALNDGSGPDSRPRASPVALRGLGAV
jgi:N-acetylglucosaminyldiphosphoundecaprenol N-acetyl-beta-D-mannosaminyltransferase